MKKTIYSSAIGVVATGLTLLALDQISPKTIKIERQITIEQPKHFVFNYLKFYKNSANWNPFLSKDPTVIQGSTGLDGTVGATVLWSGNSDIGTAEMEIKRMIEGERIDYETRFKIPFKATHQGYLTLESLGPNQTLVKWGNEGPLPYPINIICKLKGTQSTLEADFDKGLGKMKTELEKMIAIPELKL